MKQYLVSLSFMHKFDKEFVDITLSIQIITDEDIVKSLALKKFDKIINQLGLNPETLSQITVKEIE